MISTVRQYNDSLWHSTDGYDTDASEARFAALVDEEIRRRYPDAEINVYCDGESLSFVSVDDTENATAETEIAEIVQRVFESDGWYVTEAANASAH